MHVDILVILFIGMLLAHLISDYCLQGWLASAKQKVWWEKNAPDKKYKFDYIAALVCHSTMWAIFIYIPFILYSLITKTPLGLFYISLPVNIGLHCYIDDLKANKFKINLVADQLLHLVQMILTLVFFVILFY